MIKKDVAKLSSNPTGALKISRYYWISHIFYHPQRRKRRWTLRRLPTPRRSEALRGRSSLHRSVRSISSVRRRSIDAGAPGRAVARLEMRRPDERRRPSGTPRPPRLPSAPPHSSASAASFRQRFANRTPSVRAGTIRREGGSRHLASTRRSDATRLVRLLRELAGVHRRAHPRAWVAHG